MDSRKPLTAGEIEELKEEIRTMPHKEFFGENLQPLVDDHSRLLSLLAPPPDAAVREAVEHLSSGWGESAAASRFKGHVYTLIRAVQAPRLTTEQVDYLRQMDAHFEHTGTDGFRNGLRLYWPEAFAGEVGENG